MGLGLAAQLDHRPGGSQLTFARRVLVHLVQQLESVAEVEVVGAIEGLESGVAKRMDYLTRIFHNRDKIKWWVANMVASGSPDFMCAHTGAEVHFYCLNARQMAAFVRTGYDPSYGALPQQLHAKLVLEEY